MEKKVEKKIDADDVKKQLETIIDLFDRFMPKTVNVESRKEMAMYDAYHRTKNLLNTFIQ